MDNISMLSKIAEYMRIKQSAAALVQQEREMRAEILRLNFEGVNSGSRKKIIGNIMLKGTFGIEHKIDSKSFASALADDAIPDECMDGVRTSYALDKKGYDSLPDEAKRVLDDYITSKPTLPTLEIKVEE